MDEIADEPIPEIYFVLMNRSANPKFDNRAKEEILNRADIAAIIGRYVNLKQTGSSLKGLCPFHKEKTPSFHVNPSRGIFHCFGCGKGGDVFTFLMEHEGLDFKEALAMLAAETGVSLQTRAPEEPEVSGPTVSKNELFKIHELASCYFYEQLKQSSVAIDYFKTRGLSAELVREFMLGYAPDGWSGFTSHALQKGFSYATCLASGLALKKSETSSAYDRFRNRIMFPLYDIAGRVVAFAGRGMTPDAQPKYLNSPETPLYHKSKILYGLHKSRAAMKEEKSALVVEGYIDYLTLYQAGIKNAVATSGTALSSDHVQLLQRFTSAIYLVFDGDAAGIAAARRALPIFAPSGLTVKVLMLPDEEDPDSFVRKNGAAAFKELLAAQSQHYLTFGLSQALKHHPLSEGPEAKTAVITELTPLISAVADPIIRSEFIKQIAERLGLDSRLIQSRFSPLSNKYPRAAAPANPLVDASADYLRTLAAQFITLLVHHPQLFGRAQELISPDIFTDDFSAKLYSMVLKQHSTGQPIQSLVSQTDDTRITSTLSAMLAKDPPGPEQTIEEKFAPYVQRLQQEYLKYQKSLITRRIKAEPENAAALLQQQKTILSQERDL